MEAPFAGPFPALGHKKSVSLIFFIEEGLRRNPPGSRVIFI